MSTMKELLKHRNDQAARIIVQSAVLKELKAVHDADRADLKDDMDRGDKITGHAGDTSLGSVSYSDPKPKAKVTDRDLLIGHVAGERPDDVGFRITDIDAAIAVLEDVAPHLLAPALPQHIEAEYLRAAEAGDTVPGVEVTTGAPVLSVRPAAEGKRVAAELIAADPALSAQKELETRDE